MTRVDVEKSLQKAAKGAQLISRNQLAKNFFGLSPSAVPVIDAIRGCPKIGTKYSVVDLSYKIFDMQKGRK